MDAFLADRCFAPSAARAFRAESILLTRHDIEFFVPIAIGFVVRNKSSWTGEELEERAAAYGLSQAFEQSLANLCLQGWIEARPTGIYRLTEQGEIEAERMVRPFTAGER